MTTTLLSRWLVLLALFTSLPCDRGCNCGGTTSTPRHSDVPFVIVYSQPVQPHKVLFVTADIDRTARALLAEFPDLRVALDYTGQFQLRAPLTEAPKVEARRAALAAEDAKSAADAPHYLMTYPLGSLDATATFADLTQQFPGVKLDIDLPGKTVYVNANREKQLAVKARLNGLKKQNSQGNVPHHGN